MGSDTAETFGFIPVIDGQVYATVVGPLPGELRSLASTPYWGVSNLTDSNHVFVLTTAPTSSQQSSGVFVIDALLYVSLPCVRNVDVSELELQL